MSAAYLTAENEDTVALRIVGVDASVSQAIELHETRQQDGMTRMERRPGIDVPRGGRVDMAPGGLHVMLISLTRPLVAGDSIALTVRLDDGRTVPVTAVVRAP
jgi:copper(I)-binding protein